MLASSSALDDKEQLKKYLEIMRTSAKDAAQTVRRLRQLYSAPAEGEIIGELDLERGQGAVGQEIEVATGTTVAHLPPSRVTEQVGETAKWSTAEAQNGRGPLNALVVDDDPVARRVLSALLEADGHTVETASSGADALAMFDAGSHDLVFTDGMMPGMGGEELSAALKRAAPGKPIIMVTGLGDIMAEAGQGPEHFALVLSKPLTLAKLREAVGQVRS